MNEKCEVCGQAAWVPTDCGNPHEGCPRFGIGRVKVLSRTLTRADRIRRDLATFADIRIPVTLADNEDAAGRIPGDVGYNGPGK
jgi:hypothetical protein